MFGRTPDRRSSPCCRPSSRCGRAVLPPPRPCRWLPAPFLHPALRTQPALPPFEHVLAYSCNRDYSYHGSGLTVKFIWSCLSDVTYALLMSACAPSPLPGAGRSAAVQRSAPLKDPTSPLLRCAVAPFARCPAAASDLPRREACPTPPPPIAALRSGSPCLKRRGSSSPACHVLPPALLPLSCLPVSLRSCAASSPTRNSLTRHPVCSRPASSRPATRRPVGVGRRRRRR